MSQQQLARHVGVQRSAVSHWESSQGKSPTLANMRGIAAATQARFEWLATGRGAPSIGRDEHLDGIAAADALLVDSDIELRLLQAFRSVALRAQLNALELLEALAERKRQHRV